MFDIWLKLLRIILNMIVKISIHLCLVSIKFLVWGLIWAIKILIKISNLLYPKTILVTQRHTFWMPFACNLLLLFLINIMSIFLHHNPFLIIKVLIRIYYIPLISFISWLSFQIFIYFLIVNDIWVWWWTIFIGIIYWLDCVLCLFMGLFEYLTFNHNFNFDFKIYNITNWMNMI